MRYIAIPLWIVLTYLSIKNIKSENVFKYTFSIVWLVFNIVIILSTGFQLIVKYW